MIKMTFFSDSEAEETGSSKSRQAEVASAVGGNVINTTSSSETRIDSHQIASLSRETEHISLGLGNTGSTQMHVDTEPKSDAGGGAVPALEVPNRESEFKAMAADASVFTFGDDEDFESE